MARNPLDGYTSRNGEIESPLPRHFVASRWGRLAPPPASDPPLPTNHNRVTPFPRNYMNMISWVAHESPSYHRGYRDDEVPGHGRDNDDDLRTIVMSLHLQFFGGRHKELVVVWKTCVLSDNTDGFRPACDNSTSCQLPEPPFKAIAGNYQTRAIISYLSCERHRWTTKGANFYREYQGHLGWTWVDE